MHELMGKDVEVTTVETVYRGILMEVGEKEISIQSQFGWLTIPIEKVADIKAAG